MKSNTTGRNHVHIVCGWRCSAISTNIMDMDFPYAPGFALLKYSGPAGGLQTKRGNAWDWLSMLSFQIPYILLGPSKLMKSGVYLAFIYCGQSSLHQQYGRCFLGTDYWELKSQNIGNKIWWDIFPNKIFSWEMLTSFWWLYPWRRIDAELGGNNLFKITVPCVPWPCHRVWDNASRWLIKSSNDSAMVLCRDFQFKFKQETVNIVLIIDCLII